jgi:hypothetical protein
VALERAEIIKLLNSLNDELAKDGVTGELYVLGGAVMCLALEARASTQDIDGYFKPTSSVRAAAKRVAAIAGVENDWLNDAAKGYISEKGEFLELSNLRIMTASPKYLLAMKCLAMRLGAEFHDEYDVRFLLRYLDVPNYEAAVNIISRYYPLERFPQKTLYALEEICTELG